MFSRPQPEVEIFLERSRKEREERRDARSRESASVIIQRYWRGYHVRRNVVNNLRSLFDDYLVKKCSGEELSALVLLKAAHYLKFKFSLKSETKRLEALVRHIMSSVQSSSPENSFISLSMRTASFAEWISVVKWLSSSILLQIHVIDPCNPSESKILNVYLSFLLIITNYCQRSLSQECVRNALHQLNSLILEHLVDSGLFIHLQAILHKGLARNSPALTQVSLTGIFTILMRPLINSKFEQSVVMKFASHILVVPGFVLHVNSMMNEAYEIIVRECLCSKIVLALHSDPSEPQSLISRLDGTYVLCLIANLIQLSLLEEEVLSLHCTEFCILIAQLMSHLSGYVGNKKSSLTSWHPILGWFGQSLDNSLQAAMPLVTKQLHLLWNGRMVRLLFADLYDQADLAADHAADSSTLQEPSPPVASGSSTASKRLQVVGPGFPSSAERIGTAGLLPPIDRRRQLSSGNNFSHRSNRARHGLSHFLQQLSTAGRGYCTKKRQQLQKGAGQSQPQRFNFKGSTPCGPGPSDLPVSLKAVCMLYCFTVGSLKEIRNDILAGMSLGDLLPRIWRLISCCGSVRDWVKVLLHSKALPHLEPHESHLMQIFASATGNLLSILDDVELFELEKSFTVSELCAMGTFFNQLIYDTVLSVPDPASLSLWDPQSDGYGRNANLPTLFNICLRLLSIIYERDSRHPFTGNPDFWLIPTLKVSVFMSDLRKPKPHATFLLKNVPHIIPHKERLLLFRELVREDKTSLGVHTRSNWLTDEGAVGAVITVHRKRIVEDGYQQLANLTSAQLRMKIRVQFVNELGLDEVGIDLDGVFKEFLEETLRRVFDPSLNLFRVTSEQRLYPSPTSHLQENHLQLFEFLGKMLAKAIYEGIVIDVPFANFFLTQLLGREKAGCYSFLDELATLDRELYKSLSYIKHYDGDVSDLEFTYSYAEDSLGQVVVHDLYPNGRYITVTNDLKIGYVHRVARFRMRESIREQTASFIRGFYSILNPDWLAMFSPPELQKLISGDSASVNIEDLKQNTRYSGGFHGNHRVVKWLWDILRRDFSDQERSLFLKFVTSCSRPPLLGFTNLEPPFCIRCVHYANEDQDVGDTLGSVLKGFFGIAGRREEVSRLPTASTCFNLLKLPNYSTRSILRDKLRYAVNSNAGFELS